MTNVREAAVAKREAAAVNPMQVIKHELDRYAPIIGALLPKGVTVDRFKATVANAIRKTPDLLKCEPSTIVGAALRAAQLGLEPGDGRNLCHLVPYGRECQFQLGYGGILEMARRAAPGVKFDGRAVHPNDEFDVDYGKENPLVHRPAMVAKPGQGRGGEAFAWYVRARFPDGETQIHVLDRESIDYHRSFSKQPNGQMWAKSYDAAALKSVVLDMRRWLPQSSEFATALASDEQVFRPSEDMSVDESYIDAESEELPLDGTA